MMPRLAIVLLTILSSSAAFGEQPRLGLEVGAPVRHVSLQPPDPLETPHPLDGMTRAALLDEQEALIASRPGFEAAAALLVGGGWGVVLGGFSFFLGSVYQIFTGGSDCNCSPNIPALLYGGLVLGSVGVSVLISGIVKLAMTLRARARSDARLGQIQLRLDESPAVAPEPSAEGRSGPGFTLASF